MMVRKRFDEQLEELNVQLIEMGALCEDAINLAVDAFLKRDVSEIQGKFHLEEVIDQKEKDIEALCLRLLLQQQPVASDLRTISSALKMISDMERIGDQAEDIAEITKHIADRDLVSSTHIEDMAKATIKMVTESVESYVQKDFELAQAVIDYDDVVDDLFNRVKEELTRIILADRDRAEYCMDVLMISKYFERIGDHATNIAEWVQFALTGKHAEES
jgi:phosphate transport system protein